MFIINPNGIYQSLTQLQYNLIKLSYLQTLSYGCTEALAEGEVPFDLFNVFAFNNELRIELLIVRVCGLSFSNAVVRMCVPDLFSRKQV